MKENHYSDEVISEILEPSVNNCQVGDRKEGYRSWMDIIKCLLEKMIGSSEKAYVMHQCNLNKVKFQVYLDFLLSRDFVGEVKDTTETTEKGLAFLTDYRRMKASFKSVCCDGQRNNSEGVDL